MRFWCALVCGWASGLAVWFIQGQQPGFLAPVTAALVAFILSDSLCKQRK